MFWIRKLCTILLITIAVLTTGCVGAPIPAPDAPLILQGNIEAIQTGTSLWVIKQAANGEVSAFILQHKESLQTFFAAPIRSAGGWGTVALNLAKKEPLLTWMACNGTGTFYGCSDLADLVSNALKNGWDFIQPTDLPPEMGTWVATATSWIQKVNTINMPAFVVPAGMFNIQVLPTPVVR